MSTIIKLWGMVLISVILLVISCRKYQVVSNVKAVNEVIIGGLNSSYTAYLDSNYQIRPSLTFTQDNTSDTGRYKYQWFTLSQTLDSTKNLTSKVTLNPGNYTVYYVVKDTVTGVSWQKSINLTVVTPYYQGWLILSDASTAPRLDMVSYHDTGTATVIHDLLGKLGSALVLSGEAKNVACTPNIDKYDIYITTTGNGTNSVDPENFSWKPTNNIRYSILDKTIPADFYVDPFVPFDNSSFGFPGDAIYANGNVYVNSNVGYGLPVNRFNGESTNFPASPFFAGIGSIYLYDTVNKRFAYSNSNLTYSSPLPTYGTSGASLFDFNNTGMNLVYMGFNYYNGTSIFCILKEPATSIYHLAIIDYNGQSQTYYQPMAATNINAATHFTTNSDYGYVFYSVGGKLYEYDLGLKISLLMADYGASQITNIRSGIPLVNGYSPLPIQKELIVSTYDPSGPAGSNGKLEIFTVPPVNGNLVLIESYTGFGKIKDIAYRQRQ